MNNSIAQGAFAAEEGEGVYVNSRRIRVYSRSRLDDSLVAIKNVENKDFMSGVMLVEI